MTEEEAILGVPLKKIKSWRNLAGTWKYFGAAYERPCSNKQEFDALGIPDIEIAQYILQRQDLRARDDAIKASDDAIAAQQKHTWVEDREERQRKGEEEHVALYKKYLEDFDEAALTEADASSIWALSGIDLALRKNLKAQYAYYDRIDPASINNKKLLSDEVARLTTEFRQLQKMLGIDMPTRKKAEEQATGIDTVREIVEQTQGTFDKYNIPIEHCSILIGDWLHYFPEVGYDVQTKCPRCNEPIHICEVASDVPSAWWEVEDVSDMQHEAEEG